MTLHVDFDTEVIKSAKQRLDKELGLYRVVRRQVYGDEAFEDELGMEGRVDVGLRNMPAPPPGARSKLIPNWAWWKRLNGR